VGGRYGEGAHQPEMFIFTGLLCYFLTLISEACCAIPVGVILEAVHSDKQQLTSLFFLQINPFSSSCIVHLVKVQHVVDASLPIMSDCFSLVNLHTIHKQLMFNDLHAL